MLPHKLIFRAYLQCQTPLSHGSPQHQAPTMSSLRKSDPTLFFRESNIRPQQCLTTTFSGETTISGPDNVRPHTYRARLQSQAPTMSDHTLIARDYNLRPQQCQTPHFSCETTISGPDNVRPHTYRARLQSQAPTMSDPRLIA